MKAILVSAAVVFFGGASSAQENTSAPVRISTAPAQPEVQAAASAPDTPAQPATAEELKKQQNQALAELKKKQEDGIKQLKESLKGASALQVRNAVIEQRKKDREAVNALKDAHRTELGRLKKNRPGAVNLPAHAGKEEKKGIK